MYKEFYGLRANPFNVNPDPRYLFLTRHTEEALACLTYGIQSRKGFVLLTVIKLGVVGPGARLPPERELAAQLGISRLTLREAIRELARAGYVESRRGR